MTCAAGDVISANLSFGRANVPAPSPFLYNILIDLNPSVFLQLFTTSVPGTTTIQLPLPTGPIANVPVYFQGITISPTVSRMSRLVQASFL